ncbi:ubiquinol-cytochrome-c reductase complex subunit-domain-containing protein [Astrocystis sublimbata]|nr:ubiquinol-cytochrome-c reductase complex subunit-domain-containing protein [Astrocystis sublimbata]
MSNKALANVTVSALSGCPAPITERPEDLVSGASRPQLDLASMNVIDWEVAPSTTLPVHISRLDRKPMFKADRTYWVVHMSRALLALDAMRNIDPTNPEASEVLPRGEWTRQALAAGLHPGVAVLIETMDQVGQHYPRLWKASFVRRLKNLAQAFGIVNPLRPPTNYLHSAIEIPCSARTSRSAVKMVFQSPILRAAQAAQFPSYKSPYGPKYHYQSHVAGWTVKQLTGLGVKSGMFGGVALFAVIFFASGIPRVQRDILMKIPVISEHYVNETPASDNPF